jgi:hypothetical protein
VVGTCQAERSSPVRADAHRLVFAASDIAVLASNDDLGGTRRPEEMALGRASSGDWVVLLAFDPKLDDGASVDRAFLLLTPVRGARPPAGPVALEVADVLGTWRSDSTSWGRQPRLGLPSPVTAARATGDAPLRLDVTHLVRAWTEGPRGPRSVAILAGAVDAFGASFDTGVVRGPGPRLEVYLRRAGAH